jgi:hypothetical protein
VAADGTTNYEPIKMVGTIDHKAPYAYVYETAKWGVGPPEPTKVTRRVAASGGERGGTFVRRR